MKAEHIIRDDFTIEGYEGLEILCELFAWKQYDNIVLLQKNVQ